MTIGKWLWRTPLQHLIYCRCSTREGKKVIVTIDLILFKVSLLDDEEPDENWSMSVNLDMLSVSLSSFDLSSTQSSSPVKDKVEEQSVLSAAVEDVPGASRGQASLGGSGSVDAGPSNFGCRVGVVVPGGRSAAPPGSSAMARGSSSVPGGMPPVPGAVPAGSSALQYAAHNPDQGSASVNTQVCVLYCTCTVL